MRTPWTAEELLDLDANYVSVNGVRAVKLCEIRDGVYRAIRMPGCPDVRLVIISVSYLGRMTKDMM